MLKINMPGLQMFPFAIIFVLMMGCGRKETDEDQFSGFNIAAQGRGVVIMSGLGKDIIAELKTGSMHYEQWTGFFAVYPEINDPEMRDFQNPLPGEYEIRDSLVVFRPTAPFRSGQAYFARCYAPDLLAGTIELLKSGKIIATTEHIEYRFYIR